MARDIYQGLAEQWNVPIFANIARSEQLHMDAVLCLLNKYGIDDPVGENANGVFQNPVLSALYGDLKTQGAESLQAALRVGATIEDVDIRDLMVNMEKKEIDNGDIIAVFDALAKGSRNHMRAFTSQLKNNGLSYEAKYISQEELASITGSNWERGQGFCGTCTGVWAGYGPRSRGNNAGVCNGTGPRGRNARNNSGNCPYLNRGRN